MANIIEITDKFPLANKIIKIGKISVEVKTFLDVNSFVEATNTIANSCFDNNKEYHPEYYDIAKRCVVLEYLTNIILDGMSTEEIFKVTQNDWYYEIEKTCAAILCEIEDAADKIIAYRLSTRKTSFDNLCDSMSAIIKQDVSAEINGMKEILDGINKIDAKKFIQAAVNNNLAKNRGGEDSDSDKETTD